MARVGLAFTAVPARGGGDPRLACLLASAGCFGARADDSTGDEERSFASTFGGTEGRGDATAALAARTASAREGGSGGEAFAPAFAERAPGGFERRAGRAAPSCGVGGRASFEVGSRGARASSREGGTGRDAARAGGDVSRSSPFEGSTCVPSPPGAVGSSELPKILEKSPIAGSRTSNDTRFHRPEVTRPNGPKRVFSHVVGALRTCRLAVSPAASGPIAARLERRTRAHRKRRSFPQP